MTIGIIGAGAIGGAFAKALGKAGIEAVISNSRGPVSISGLVSTFRLDGPDHQAGDSTVRKLLYEAANSILTRTKQSFALKSWALKIAKRRGLRKARVALARRLAVIMHAMLRDGTLFEA